MIPHIRIIGYDDWHCLYVDTEQKFSGHSVDPFHIAEAAGGNPFTLEVVAVNEAAISDYFEFAGDLPDDYNDIPQEVFA